MKLYSYIVRYDSGFAPNPFYNYCTLATCKKEIRKTASTQDWVIGFGSASKRNNQGGKLVYAMKVTEILTFNEYANSERFQYKKPVLNGSRKQARGDNIYEFSQTNWNQLNSYHSHNDGTINTKHINRDTSVNMVLISDDYAYFGCGGPYLPDDMNNEQRSLLHIGQGYRKFDSDNPIDKKLMDKFFKWFGSLECRGQIGIPFDWKDIQ